MSLKTLLQLMILILIFGTIGGVYFKYFAQESVVLNNSDEKNNEEIITKNNENGLNNLENKKNKISETNISKNLKVKKSKDIQEQEVKEEKNNSIISNLVKDVEYITSDKKGNKFKIIATSGKTNKKNINILNLVNVKGEITSLSRSTIKISSDFAEYNSSNFHSKFYSKVIINYEDKQIKCENFDINMDSNIAIAYNNVVITDTMSTMKAGKISLNIETKEIEINPQENKKIKVITEK